MSKPNGPVCNLDCDYCFYLKKLGLFDNKSKKEFHMSDETLNNYIKSYIDANASFGEVNFAWQGGEPLISGIEFFREVVTLQEKYAHKGVKVSNSLQTNGTLIDDSYAQFFKEHNFLIGISIDGPEDVHDFYRKDPQGNGTFHRVINGVEKLKKHGVDFNTLTVVQAHNNDKAKSVYTFLKSIGSTFMQFIPIVEKEEGGGLSHRSVHDDMFGQFLIDVFNEWVKEDIGKVFIGHFDLMLGLYAGYPSSICVHSKTCGSAMAIEHNGNIYSCDHFVMKENYLGNINSEVLTDIVYQEKQHKFGQDKFDRLPKKCLDCRYLKLCYGGCPKNRDRGNLNHLCSGYFKFYEYTEPYFFAMKKAIDNKVSPHLFRQFLPDNSYFKKGRNDPCYCLSGKKFKNCCGARD